MTEAIVASEFELVNSEVKELTRELAEEFRLLEASPTERSINKKRMEMLRQKAESKQLITFQWSTAMLGDKTYRMNGQHSCNMLCSLNGQFPTGLKVHIDNYRVNSKDGLALLFRQFDDRKSGRTTADVAGAYQGIYDVLAGVPTAVAKLGAEAVAWYREYVVGVPPVHGDDRYALFGVPSLHPFLLWLPEIIRTKTPELRKKAVVAAIYGTFHNNEVEARDFWEDVAREGGDRPESQAGILDTWLIEMHSRKPDLKDGSYYQACAYAWNAFRDEKPIATIRYPDIKKNGFLTLMD